MTHLMTTEVERRAPQDTETPWSSGIPFRSQWELQAFRGVFRMETLQRDWDTYGGPPPTLVAVNSSLDVLRSIAGLDFEDLPVPYVVPVPGGGIQLEWNVGEHELEVEILPDGRVEYLKEEGRGPVEQGPLKPGQIRLLLAWLVAAR